MHLLFSFEYVILASAIISTFLKYTLSMVDAWLEGRWEHKGVYVFYLELLTDMLHLFVYLVFFVIVFTNFGLPVHLVRPLCCMNPGYNFLPLESSELHGRIRIAEGNAKMLLDSCLRISGRRKLTGSSATKTLMGFVVQSFSYRP